jgi:hypothetical protein
MVIDRTALVVDPELLIAFVRSFTTWPTVNGPSALPLGSSVAEWLKSGPRLPPSTPPRCSSRARRRRAGRLLPE